MQCLMNCLCLRLLASLQLVEMCVLEREREPVMSLFMKGCAVLCHSRWLCPSPLLTLHVMQRDVHVSMQQQQPRTGRPADPNPNGPSTSRAAAAPLLRDGLRSRKAERNSSTRVEYLM